MRKKKWAVGDVVDIKVGKTLDVVTGTITELREGKAVITSEDDETWEMSTTRLKEHQGQGKTPAHQGFSQYNVTWDKDTINFNFSAEDQTFYGWWRKLSIAEGGIAYAIDLYVKVGEGTKEERNYAVDSISYQGPDPRRNLQSLNADICALASKWFYHKCRGTKQTIEELEQKASKPTITITQLETIDSILTKLKEYRDTAIGCGGLRVFTFTGDDPEHDPTGGMRIQLDLSAQAKLVEGRIPSLASGVVFDRVVKDHKKGSKGLGEPLDLGVDKTNLEELIHKLKSTKDKSEQRKLRGILRKMGHRGGTRVKKGDE